MHGSLTGAVQGIQKDQCPVLAQDLVQVGYCGVQSVGEASIERVQGGVLASNDQADRGEPITLEPWRLCAKSSLCMTISI